MIRSQKGFTMIEMLMVIMLVAILAAVAIPQFLDFRTEAKQAAVAAAVGALRSGIVNQKGQMVLRCNAAPSAWPAIQAIEGNSMLDPDITANPCTGLIPAGQEAIVSGNLPANPWGFDPNSNAVVACTGAGCAKTAACDAVAWNTTTGVAGQSGWCYNPATGDIWANSARSTAPVKEYSL